MAEPKKRVFAQTFESIDPATKGKLKALGSPGVRRPSHAAGSSMRVTLFLLGQVALAVGCGTSLTPQGLTHCEPLSLTELSGSYASLAGLEGGPLREALLKLVDGHTSLGYDGAKKAAYSSPGVDVRDGKVECVYTGRLYQPDQLDKTGGFNVEHSWPQSEGAEGIAKSDLHHLFPSDPKINSSRGNLNFGETDCSGSGCRVDDPGGTQIGPRIDGDEVVCEVRPARRGDIARAHFYFAVRYALTIPALEEERLREWNRCDPPDDAERARNEAIERLQLKRNPFVDHPALVERIGGF